MLFHETSGQSSDTLFVAAALQNSIHSYNVATANQSGLYNGGDYAEPARTNENHPYFLNEDWQNGSVEYKGQVYENLPLLYDLTSQRLVSELFNGQLFSLVTEHVRWFTLGERRFVNIDNNSVNKSLPVSGYYEEVYDGRSTVLALHVKTREERIESSSIQVYFNARARYYILYNGNFVRITNKSSLLKLMSGNKSEMRSFINKQKLSFKRGALSNALAAAASHYDTLKPETQR
jgi:hypothetical protein